MDLGLTQFEIAYPFSVISASICPLRQLSTGHYKRKGHRDAEQAEKSQQLYLLADQLRCVITAFYPIAIQIS